MSIFYNTTNIISGQRSHQTDQAQLTGLDSQRYQSHPGQWGEGAPSLDRDLDTQRDGHTHL